jgi:PAS domain S-box-containing protein
MIEQFTDDPKLSRYIVSFRQGETLFLEGEDSQNLYILLEGQLDVLKGEQVINIISEPGAVFGEMSFLLGAKRTATVRAGSEVRAVSIPREEINNFLSDFPELSQKMTRLLARRLDATSHVLFGLKEFSDMLPDAVVLTDKNGKVVALNRAATELYGREWRQVGQRPLEGLFEQAEQVREFACAAAAGQTAQEKVVTINHPHKGLRYVSLSISGLYNAQQEFKGLLMVGRDVTSTQRLKRRLHRLRVWFVAVTATLALCAAGLMVYSYLAGEMMQKNQRQVELRNQLARDQLLLTSLLAEPVAKGRLKRIHELLTRFFQMPQSKLVPYTGLTILDPAKKVIEAFSPSDDQVAQRVGTSYGHIDFSSQGSSNHGVLTVFHQDRRRGGSRRELALAFRLTRDGKLIGWLLMGLDPQRLEKQFGVDRDELAAMDLVSPVP